MTVRLTANEVRLIQAAKDKAKNAIDLFRPLEYQERLIREFSLHTVMECLLSGGNRSGKSVLIAAYITALLLDKPITFDDGTKFYVRPKEWQGQPLLVWGIGRDWKHIGETLYRLLFKPGAFKICNDNGVWRAYNPITDLGKFVPEPAPPFIPRTAIDPATWDWENRKARQLHSVTFKADGTRLVFYPSTAEVAQGNPVHFIWIDESIDNDAHYAEWLMRIVEYEGKIIWTTWPTTEPSPAMMSLKERGEVNRGAIEPTALFYQFRGSDNPHMPAERREAALATMSLEEREARDRGTFAMDSWLMYPMFSRGIHCALPADTDRDDKLARAIREAKGIPLSWTRYLALDPGTAHPAALLIAVPPPWEFGDFVVPYKEIYPGRADAKRLAEIIRRETPHEDFETFIADYRAAQQVTMGLGHSVADVYSTAFREFNLRSHSTGSSFVPGIDVPEVRIGMLHEWMAQRRDGTYKLRIFGCPNLCDQIERYRRQSDPGTRKPTDKPSKHQQVDVATCLEYLAGHQPTYVRRDKETVTSPGLAAWNAFVKSNSGARGQSVHCGPGQYSSS